MQKSSIIMQICKLLQIRRCNYMFYERFIQLCEINNEKPTNVLRTIGISSGNLINWKKGTSVKSDILMLLSDYFNVSVDYLLGREEKNATNINTANNSQIDNSTVIGVSNGKQYDETANELILVFKELSFSDKAKVMSLVAELSEKNKK